MVRRRAKQQVSRKVQHNKRRRKHGALTRNCLQHRGGLRLLSAGRRPEAACAASIMAAVTVTDSPGVSQRSGRVLAARGGGGSAETWKRHIVRQLKNRDLSQHTMFQDLIRFCTTHKYKLNVFKTVTHGLGLVHVRYDPDS